MARLGLFMAGASELAEPTRPTIDFWPPSPPIAGGLPRYASAPSTLGHAGLLDGRRVPAHWTFAQQLQSKFPAATVEADSLYLEDRGIWASAGMAAGADLAMSMVERDLGTAITQDIARPLIMCQRRHAR